MDKIKRALQKLTDKEREIIKLILNKLKGSETKNVDIARLKGHEDVYRVRKGDLRIIFYMKSGEIRLLKIDRRSESTYREF